MKEAEKMLLDHPLLTRVLFYPRRLSPAEIEVTPGGRVEMIAGRDGIQLGAYWHRPHPAASTVLFFHGNGEVMTDYLFGFHRELESLGLNFLIVDYRGYGLSSGTPSLSGVLEDAHAAWEHAVRRLQIPAEDIIVMGRSLGSVAALEIASEHGSEFRALIIESGVAVFHQWVNLMEPFLLPLGLDLSGLKAALEKHFNQEEKIKAVRRPILILHAPYDEIVPVEHAQQLAAAADPSLVTLHIFATGGHNDIQVVNPDYFEVLRRFVARL